MILFDRPLGLLMLLSLPTLFFLYRRGFLQKEQKVSSLYLWKKLISALDSQQTLSKRKLPASFYLWCVSLAGVSLALSSPYFRVTTPPKILFLFENSARMGTRRSEGGTRLDSLKDQALKLLQKFPANAEVRLCLLPRFGRVEVGKPAEIRSRIQSLETEDLPCDLEKELSFWSESASEGASVFLFSDRMPAGLAPWIVPVLAGDPSNNVGFVALDCKNLSCKAVVKNFSSRLQEREVLLRVSDGPALSLRHLVLQPGETSFVENSGAGNFLQFSLSPADELEADDSLFLLQGQKFRVAIPSTAPSSLRRAFLAIPDVELVESLGSSRAQDWDLWLGMNSSDIKSGPTLLFDFRGAPFEPQFLQANDSSSLGRLLSFEGLRIEKAFSLERTGEVLLSGRDSGGVEHALIVLEGKSLSFGFDLSKTNWTEHPSFPVFWAAWVEELRTTSGKIGFVRTGEETRKIGFSRSDGRVIQAANLLDPEQSRNDGETRLPPELSLHGAAEEEKKSLVEEALLVAGVCFLLAWLMESMGR